MRAEIQAVTERDHGVHPSRSVFVADLREISAETIEVHISSGGGDVFDGLAMYRALLDHEARTAVRIDSLAASIASVMAEAGDTVVIAPNAQMMIHDAWCGCAGNAVELCHTANRLDGASDNTASTYAHFIPGQGKKTAAVFAALMSPSEEARDIDDR